MQQNQSKGGLLVSIHTKLFRWGRRKGLDRSITCFSIIQVPTDRKGREKSQQYNNWNSNEKKEKLSKRTNNNVPLQETAFDLCPKKA